MRALRGAAAARRQLPAARLSAGWLPPRRLPAARLRQAFAGFVIVLALFLLYDNLPKLF